MISLVLPIRLVSVANLREHWAKKAKRTAEHRSIASMALRKHTHLVYEKDKTLKHILISISRIAPRMLDGDNLQSACKGLRDGIADALLVPDNHPNILWEYKQHRGRPKEYAVHVEIWDVGTWQNLPAGWL